LWIYAICKTLRNPWTSWWESIISYISPYSVIKPHFQSQLQRRLHSNLMRWKSSLQKIFGCNPWLKVFPKCSAALWNSMLCDVYLSTGKLSLIPCNLSGTVCLHPSLEWFLQLNCHLYRIS
jgi:hypothetical protein